MDWKPICEATPSDTTVLGYVPATMDDWTRYVIVHRRDRGWRDEDKIAWPITHFVRLEPPQ